ncbi:MAG: WD40/YVTN/BNR-like repeat-containing protein [Rhizomicrobium sp.]
MNGRRAIVSTRKGLFVFTRGERGWRRADTHFAGQPVTLALADERDGALYAALNLGHFGPKLHRSDDGGASWQEIAVPAFPQGEGNPALKQIWSLETGGAGEPGRLWAGGIPAGLFVSDDRGASWRLVDALWNVPERTRWFGGGYDDAGIHSVLVDPRDPAHVTVGISCGGVWETRDGGQGFSAATDGIYAAYVPPAQKYDTAVQDPHRVVCCGAHPDTLWLQHHSGVFHSTNGARQWGELFPAVSNFGFAVAAHPKDPLTAWFVPAHSDQRREPVDAAMVVTRTRDGGRSFDILRSGLPAPAYDLVYRHGLDVDETGDCLVMGSTTGGLWFSENGGEDWQMEPARLPPVYAVRFG